MIDTLLTTARERAALAGESVEERTSRLFATSAMTAAAERMCDARVSALAQEFVRTSAICTGIPLESLVARFQDSRIPNEPADMAAYLDELAQTVVLHATHTSSPRFIGHMTAALPYMMRPLAKLMAALNQNVVKMETARSFSPLERQTLAMLHRLVFDYDDAFYAHHVQNSASTLGMITSGGTVANITALWCARNASLGPRDGFAGIDQEGLPAALGHYGYSGAVVLGSSLMHYSFDKAADLLGIGTRNLIRVPADRHNCIDLRALRQTIAACRSRGQHIIALVGVAGTTDSGGVDPLAELAAIARTENIHFHVDAAWGGPLLFSDQHRHKLAGIAQADTVVIDGHKQLYVPMGIGMLLLREPHLAGVIEKQARYIVRAGSIDLGKRALEGSRPGMALLLHAALMLIGRQGYAFLIDEGIRKTAYLADAIRTRHEFELLAEPTINILLYRYIPKQWRTAAAAGQLDAAANQAINRFNECLQKAQRRAGRTFVSRTMSNTTGYGPKQAIIALRAVIANPRTGEADIDAVLDDQVAIATELESLNV